MSLPGFTAEAAIDGSDTVYAMVSAPEIPATRAMVTPQLCVNSPCLHLPSGQFCLNLPIVGRRCVNIPDLGSWRIRCCTRWGWPPVSCGIQRC